MFRLDYKFNWKTDQEFIEQNCLNFDPKYPELKFTYLLLIVQLLTLSDSKKSCDGTYRLWKQTKLQQKNLVILGQS